MNHKKPIMKSNSFPTFLSSYRRSIKWYNTRRSNLRSQLSAIEAELSAIKDELAALKRPSWVDRVVRPIGEMILSKLPGYRMEIWGPFGLCSETSIHFYKEGVPQEKEEDNCRLITFVPSHSEGGFDLFIRDTKKDTGEYRPGTIGYRNGMNNPRVEIPESADVDWFLQWI